MTTRAAVKSLRASITHIEDRLANRPRPGDAADIRTDIHYLERSRLKLAGAERTQVAIVARLAELGEDHTLR